MKKSELCPETVKWIAKYVRGRGGCDSMARESERQFIANEIEALIEEPLEVKRQRALGKLTEEEKEILGLMR